MQDKDRADGSRRAQFGAEFGALMARLATAFEELVVAEAGNSSDRTLRRRVATQFEGEAEQLIAKHEVQEPVAAYVRHVVREGFEVDFDYMDPTERSPGARPGKADDA